MTDIAQLLGKDADSLLQHRCMTIPADQLYLPGHDYVDRVMVDNNRPPAVLRNMQTLYNTGRLGGPGIFLFCRLTRALSTPRAPPLRRTRCISIRRTSSNWR
ncbi:fructose-bisphosphate aldolase [Enterobacter ludwigii]|nr:fructose-bisphosphate aldolase [Enterobacter ludwigii]